MNKFFTVIKKIGEKIISIVEWPFVHSVHLGKMLADVEKDTPLTAKALVNTVKQFEVLGADAIAAFAEHGLNIPDDLKVGVDIKGIFTQVKDELFPAIENEAKDLVADAKPMAPAPTVPANQPNPNPVAVTDGALAPQ